MYHDERETEIRLRKYASTLRQRGLTRRKIWQEPAEEPVTAGENYANRAARLAGELDDNW